MKPDANDFYLERGAPADLWRRTLAQIPSTFGRLIYLSSLRSPGGTYEHFGFTQAYGLAAAQTAMLESHEEAFATWLGFSLEEQKADLDLYLAGLMPEREAVIDTWLRLAPYRNLVPSSARESERRMFLADFGALLELLRIEYRLEHPDPER
jgi:hypothetical protein